MPSIEQYYENYWEDPESYSDPTTPQRQALLTKALAAMPKGSLILDVGCGRGEFCDFFVKQGHRAEGTDLSHAAVKYAQQHFPAATFHACLVEDMLPARAGAFDAVFSSEVIEHLFDVGTYLMAINHLLKDGGTFILTTPYHGLAKNIMIDLLNYSGHYDPMGQHIRFFDTKGMDRCLRTFGFEPVHWWGYGRPWPFWKSFFVVARKVAQAKPMTIGTQGRTS
jgi:2-polyprenyl-6-hydroxyphenyl methylase/3-demethylubiquinone-9 3-methyltransferase